MARKSGSQTLTDQRSKLIKAIEGVALVDVMKDVPEMIKQRTREGYGLSDKDGRKKPLAKLSPETIKQRERLKKSGGLSQETTPNKSNLTRTGQMLDSLKMIVKNKKSITIEPTGRRQGRDKISNKVLSDYVERAGRRYLELTAGEKTLIDNRLKTAINKAVKKAFE